MKSIFGTTAQVVTPIVPVLVEKVQHSGDELDKEPGVEVDRDQNSESDSDAISPDAQPGVQRVEAMTKVWSKAHLITAYVM